MNRAREIDLEHRFSTRAPTDFPVLPTIIHDTCSLRPPVVRAVVHGRIPA